MSSHNGVSCDSCLKTNFSGRRYKCLHCDNYDLCGSCYDMNAESENHVHTHPMQCILTKAAYELFYAGELISYRTVVSLTCPYCGSSGFIPHTLLLHCLEKHSIILSETKTNQVVMCPICVINPLEGYQSRFVSLADHIAREHSDIDLPVGQIPRFNNKKEESDHGEDEEEGLPLYVLAERLLTNEENRQQQAARQRFAQTIVRNDRASPTFGRHATAQRPPRHAAMRGSRANNRGHFNNFPYGNVPRTTTGSFRIPCDTNIDNGISSDPYTTILFTHDPLFDFESPFSDLSNAPFYLTTASAAHELIPESIHTERILPRKSHLSNMKQKRFNPMQQHITQSMTLTEPPVMHYQVWPQEISSSLNDINNVVENAVTTENNKINENPSENDPRSLLGKNLEHESVRTDCEQDRTIFLQSLLYSLMNISITNAQ